MTILSTNPWESDKQKSALIPLPAPYIHSLHISTSGRPRRSPTQPVIILFTGGGVPCKLYIRLTRLLAEKWRVYAYDRAGYDESEVAPREGSAGDVDVGKGKSREEDGRGVLERRMLGFEAVKPQNIEERERRKQEGRKEDVEIKEGNWEGIVMAEDAAKELQGLMTAIGVKGPYVLIAHSYGGIVAREFMALMNQKNHTSDTEDQEEEEEEGIDKVIGLALMETGSELLYHTYQPSIPPPAFESMMEGVDVGKISHLREECGLTEKEWNEGIAAIERTIPGADLEDNRGSARVLALKKQIENHLLDPYPVAVLKADWRRDWKSLYDAGVKRGNGTEEERKVCRWFMEELDVFDYEVKAGQLGLTRCGEEKRRYRFMEGCGHDVVIRRPEVVVEEVEWVMEVLKQGGWR